MSVTDTLFVPRTKAKSFLRLSREQLQKIGKSVESGKFKILCEVIRADLKRFFEKEVIQDG